MFNPIIAILFNLAAKTYHPIVFVEAPLPGPPEAGKPIRHKSKMHHTGGFKTREEAVESVTGDLTVRIKEQSGFEPKIAIAKDIEWDGNGIPAISTFFVETPEGWVHAI